MLCGICTALDWASLLKQEKQTYSHHKSFTDLLESAERGCHLCSLIVHNSGTWRSGGKDHEAVNLQSAVTISPRFDRFDPRLRIDGLYINLTRTQREQQVPTISLRVFIHPESDEPLWNLIVGRSVEDRVHEVINPEGEMVKRDVLGCRIATHINTCLESHRFCKRSFDMLKLPTRVIDCRPDDGVWARLIEPNDTDGFWVSLSHCWGKQEASKGLNATQTTLPTLLEAITPESLPATIRDAITFTTTKIGIRYLWVDSLCILQGDDGDFRHEVGNMARYYKEAFATLAIDSAKGDNEGFLHTIESYGGRLPAAAPVEVKMHGEPATFFIDDQIFVDEVHFGFTPLSRRAWTLQETVLSTIVLHITRDQIVWHCRSEAWAESRDRQLRPSISQMQDAHPKFSFLQRRLSLTPNEQDQDAVEPEIRLTVGWPDWSDEPHQYRMMNIGESMWSMQERYLHRWYEWLNEFRLRALTCPKDKFPAISGIAREMQTILNFQYKGGIWIEDACRGLAWHLVRYARHVPDRAPSWSWAAWDESPHTFPNLPDGRLERLSPDYGPLSEFPQAQVIADLEIHQDEDPFLEIHPPGYLLIKARTVPLALWQTDTTPHINNPGKYKTRLIESHDSIAKDELICEFDSPGQDGVRTQADLDGLTLLELGTWNGRLDEIEEFIDRTYEELRTGPPSGTIHDYDTISNWTSSHTIEQTKHRYIVIALILKPTGTPGMFRREGIAEFTYSESLLENWQMTDVVLE